MYEKTFFNLSVMILLYLTSRFWCEAWRQCVRHTCLCFGPESGTSTQCVTHSREVTETTGFASMCLIRMWPEEKWDWKGGRGVRWWFMYCTNLQVKHSWEIDVPEYGGRALSAGTQLGWKLAWWRWSKWWCSICPKDSSTSCANVWPVLHQPLAYPEPTWEHN